MTMDKMGMIASSICGIHCVLIPFALVMFPFLSIAAGNGEMFEVGFIVFSVVLAIFAMINGYAYHKKRVPAILAFAGLGIFVFSHVFIGHDIEKSSFTSVAPFLIGGFFIFTAHYLNHKLTKTHKCACDHIGDGKTLE